MSSKSVRDYFKKWNMEDRILEFDSSTSTAEEAADMLGKELGQIAKSLTFNVRKTPIMVVMSGDAKIDKVKYKDKFHKRAEMIRIDDVEETIGHDVGGVCPFVINEKVRVYLDLSLKRYEKIYPAAGCGSSLIELTIEELEKHSNAEEWVDVTEIQ